MDASIRVFKVIAIQLLLLLLTNALQLSFITRCYGEYGCFSNWGKFITLSRPINLFPSTPEKINLKLNLFTRKNPGTIELLKVDDVTGVNQTNFNFSMPTKLIIHGYTDSGNNIWCLNMKDELLINNNFNVIIVDWEDGAKSPYIQAVANTRLVGAMIARFLQLIQTAYGYPPQMSHIIGHSLGAHTAGYAGERLNKLGRISGMDPAGPYFENTDPVVRLDKTDAMLVDVMHTNGFSLLAGDAGINMQVGHMDFYPNGGFDQPGCYLLEAGFQDWLGCSHNRAYKYYTESINNCTFQSYECANDADFLDDLCNKCEGSGNSCASMGFHADDYLNGNVINEPIKFYLNTNKNPPYCITNV